MCSLCPSGFSYSKDLRIHIETVHEGKRPHVCPKCDAKFARREKLKKHLLRVHEKIKPFVCNYCGHGFFDNYHLKTHINNVHEGKKSVDLMKTILMKSSMDSQIEPKTEQVPHQI